MTIKITARQNQILETWRKYENEFNVQDLVCESLGMTRSNLSQFVRRFLNKKIFIVVGYAKYKITDTEISVMNTTQKITPVRKNKPNNHYNPETVHSQLLWINGQKVKVETPTELKPVRFKNGKVDRCPPLTYFK